ncbi:MAG: hypothetical protein KAS86_05590, partial [Candidatus Omnitrophica bacterium]|nr:hypothetical protein [Candidatus Omnitrophota bacterium]
VMAYGLRLDLAAMGLVRDLDIVNLLSFSFVEIVGAVIGFLTMVGIFKYILFGSGYAQRTRRFLKLLMTGGAGYLAYSLWGKQLAAVGAFWQSTDMSLGAVFSPVVTVIQAPFKIFGYLSSIDPVMAAGFFIAITGAAIIYYLRSAFTEQSNEVQDQDILDFVPPYLLRELLNRARQNAIDEGKQANLPAVIRDSEIAENDDVKKIFRNVSRSYKGWRKLIRLMKNEPLSDWVVNRIRMSRKLPDGKYSCTALDIANIVNNVRDREKIIQVLSKHGYLSIDDLDVKRGQKENKRITNLDILAWLDQGQGSTLERLDEIVNDEAIAHEIFEPVVLMATLFGDAEVKNVIKTAQKLRGSYHGRIDIALALDDDDASGTEAARDALRKGGGLAGLADNVIIHAGSNQGVNLGTNQRKVRMKPVLDVELVQALKKHYGEHPEKRLPGFVELIDAEDRVGSLLLKSKALLWRMQERTVEDQIAGFGNRRDSRRWGLQYNGIFGQAWKLRFLCWCTVRWLKLWAWGANADIEGKARARAAFMLEKFNEIYSPVAA